MIDSNSDLKKSQVHPRIQTQPTQTECHHSTTCATTTSSVCENERCYFHIRKISRSCHL